MSPSPYSLARGLLWDCPPSTFGLFANGAAKLLSYWGYLFLTAILSTEKRVALSYAYSVTTS